MADTTTAGAQAQAPLQQPIPSRTLVLGDQSLIRFTADPNGPAEGDQTTVWLYDKPSHSLRPFSSMDAFTNYYGANATLALSRVANINPIELSPAANGNPAGFLDKVAFLGSDYAVRDDGYARRLDYNPKEASERYGKAQVPEAENMNMGMLAGSFQAWKSDPSYRLDPSIVSKITNDPSLMAFYTNAITYGGYTFGDIYQDAVRRQMIAGGNTSMETVQVISPTQNRSTYATSVDGRNALSNPLLVYPVATKGVPVDALNYTPQTLPQEYYKQLVPTVDVNSDVFKAKAEEIKSYVHDLYVEAVNAKTEQERQIAKGKYDDFRKQLDQQYGWKLSDNALAGWQQLENIQKQYEQANLSGSGMEREAMDDYIKTLGLQDERLRQTKETSDKTEYEKYLMQYGSPQEVNDYITKNPDRAIPLGFKASDASKQAFSVAALKAKYPNITDDAAKAYAASFIDENGNLRSASEQSRILEEMNTKFGIYTGYKPTTSLDTYQNQQAAQAFEAEDLTKRQNLAKDVANAPIKAAEATSQPAVVPPEVTPQKTSAPLAQAPTGVYRTGLSTSQVAGLDALKQKPQEQWTAIDKANWTYATTQPKTTTIAAPKTTVTVPTAPKVTTPTTSAVTSPAFRTGLNQTQVTGLTNLQKKPKEQWTSTDKANWAYGTTQPKPVTYGPTK